MSREKLDFALGITGKVRDAKISLSNENTNSEKTDLGFVPLIHFSFAWKFHSKFNFLIDGDALAAPQGRAEDVLVAVDIQAIKNLKIKTGYRILEGGADNDAVYTFALVHYLVFGLTFNF